METTYKAKYQQLKMQYMHAVDTAFRLGFEQGQQQAQMQQAVEAQAQAEQAAQMQAQGGQPGAPGQMGAEGQEDPQAAAQEQMEPASEHPDGSELDQHIAKLESMIAKSEEPEEMRKTLDAMKSFRKNQLLAIELKKSHQAIKGIAAALHKPQFKMSVQASHNMNDNAKKALSMQEKIVDDVMAKWEEEESKASKDISDIISIEGLTKKE